MTIESRRNEIMSKNRKWGENVPAIPHTAQGPSSSPPRHKLDTPALPSGLSDLDDSMGDHRVEALDNIDRAREDQQPNHFMVGSLHSDASCSFLDSAPTMASTRGWSHGFLLGTGSNFHEVHRVSATSPTLSETIQDVFELKGHPLVIEGFHMHPRWPKRMFTLEHFASNVEGDDILVRNVHNRTDTKIPISEFISRCRASGPYKEDNEEVRFYGKDSECPKTWENWLQTGGAVPRSLISNGPEDLFRYRPKSAPVETLMCYLGIGDTFTPCHKDLCASSGQNLMCYTENGGSSFWFMTESSDAPVVARYFQQLGQELDHESHVITLQELKKAPFKVFLVEQKLGDLVLVPPRSCHQVVNFGGITIKSSWSRMTLKGLSTAYYHELPIYRRVCRPETYRVKSTILHTLIGRVKDLENFIQPSSLGHVAKSVDENALTGLVKEVKELLSLYDSILVEEHEPGPVDMVSRRTSRPPSIEEDILVSCDFCGCDIFQSFFECGSSSDGCVVCPGCYVEGRNCKCENTKMRPMQYRDFQQLIKVRRNAVKALTRYEEHRGGSFELKLDLNVLGVKTAAVFRAACILYRNRAKSTRSTKQCSQFKGWQTSHTVDFPSALTCKQCHNARCFTHILVDFKMHSVEALLFHSIDDTHAKYHSSHHSSSRRNSDPEIQSDLQKYQKQGTPPDPFLQLSNAASMYGDCKPIETESMDLGWYDNRSQPAATIMNDSDEASLASPSSDTVEVPSTRLEVKDVTSIDQDILDEILREVKRVPAGSKERKPQVYVQVPRAAYSTPTSRLSATVVTRHLAERRHAQTVSPPGPCKPSGVTNPTLPDSAKKISGQPRPIQRTVLTKPKIHPQLPGRRQKDNDAMKMNLLPLARSLTSKDGACRVTGSAAAKSAISSLRFKKKPQEDIQKEPEGGSLAPSLSGDNVLEANSSDRSSSSEKPQSKEPALEKLFMPPNPVEPQRPQGYGHAAQAHIVDLASTILQEMGSMMMEGANQPVVCNNPAWSNIPDSPINRRPPSQHLYSNHCNPQVYRRHQYYGPQRAQNSIPKRKNTQGFAPLGQRHSYPQHNNAACIANTHPTYETQPSSSSDPHDGNTRRTWKQVYFANKHHHDRPPQPPPSNFNGHRYTGWPHQQTTNFDGHNPRKRKHEPQPWRQGNYFSHRNEWHSTPQLRSSDLGEGPTPKKGKYGSRHWDPEAQPQCTNFNEIHLLKQSTDEGQQSRNQTKRRSKSRWDIGPEQFRQSLKPHVNPDCIDQYDCVDHTRYHDLEQRAEEVVRTPLIPNAPPPETPAESGMPNQLQYQPALAIEGTPPPPTSTPPPIPMAVDSVCNAPSAELESTHNASSKTPDRDLLMEDELSNWEDGYEQEDDGLEQDTPVAFRVRDNEPVKLSDEFNLTFNPWNASPA